MSTNRFEEIIESVKKSDTEKTLNDFAENLIAEIEGPIEKETGVSQTFYLKKDISDKLAKLSKKTGKSKSYIVNKILTISFNEFF